MILYKIDNMRNHKSSKLTVTWVPRDRCRVNVDDPEDELESFWFNVFGSLMRRSEWYTVVYETCSIVNDCYETIPTYIFVFCWTVYHCTKTKGCSNEFLLNATRRVTGRTSLLIHYHEQKSSNWIRPIHRKPIHLNLTKFQSINRTETD